jgi:hypothetical protein
MQTEFLYPTQKPKILLINFEKADEEVLKAKNYNVERGWASSNSHHFPSPGYEYDIVIARFDEAGYNASRSISQYGMTEDQDYYHLTEKLNGTGFVLAFAEDDSLNFNSLRQCGIEDIEIVELDERDTQYEVVASTSALDGHQFSCSLLKRIAGDIKLPIPRGLDWRKSNTTTTPIFSLANNASGKVTSCISYNKESVWNGQIGRYEDFYHLKYVVLPPLTKGHIRVATDFLSQLPNWRPDLFPSDSNYSWLSSERYSSKESLAVEAKINGEIIKFENRIQELQEEQSERNLEDQYLRQLLIADDGDEFEMGQKFTDASRTALEYLGFNVQNTEKDTKTGKRREDLVCKIDDFTTLVECKGTVSQNPPESYASQLLNHMLASKCDRGILLINHDRKRDAFARVPIYEDAQHIWKETENILVVASVELFKLIRKVQNGELSKDDARKLLMQTGRLQIA